MLMDYIFTPEAITAFVVLGAVAGVARKYVWPFMRAVVHMSEDIRGTEGRPGVPGRAGVMQSIEELRLAINGEPPQPDGSGGRPGLLRDVRDLRDGLSTLQAATEAREAKDAEQSAKIDAIHHEVHYNSGSSVKDAVARTEAGVSELRQAIVGKRAFGELSDLVTEALADHSRMDARLDDHERTIAALSRTN